MNKLLLDSITYVFIVTDEMSTVMLCLEVSQVKRLRLIVKRKNANSNTCLIEIGYTSFQKKNIFRSVHYNLEATSYLYYHSN